MRANFENMDSNFFKKWKAKEAEIGGLTCEMCHREEEQDAELLESLAWLGGAQELYHELHEEGKNCQHCSQKWCNFTFKMLHSYIDETFKEFSISNKKQSPIQDFMQF